MLSYEKIDEAFINDTSKRWSEKLKTTTSMIAALVILLLAVLFSLAWRDQPVQGREELSSIRKNPPKA
jgi:hypothetical protein